MAERFVVAELLTRKHIAKYLQCKLDPARAGRYPLSDELARHIAQLCGWRVQLMQAPAEDLRAPRYRLHLTLAGDAPHDLSPEVHNRILDMVENVYRSEFHAEVDNLHLRMGMPMFEAVETFRRQYGITEDDFPTRHSHRCYQRHLRREYPEMKRAAGRPLLPMEALNPKYRRRLALSAARGSKRIKARHRRRPLGPVIQMDLFAPDMGVGETD